MEFDDFKAVVRETCGRAGGPGSGLLAIPALRRRCADLSREQFDAYVLRFQEEGAIHLLTHVDSDKLPQADRDDAIRHPSGLLLYWIRCL